MKKQKLQLVILLVVLAVFAAATFGMKWYNKNKAKEKTAEEEAATIYISKVDTDSITAFSYEVNQVTYSFTKDGDTWTYDGDTSINIDADAINTMLDTFSALTATDEITYDNFSDFGLDKPTDLVTYTTADGFTTIYVGNKNDMLGSYYVMTGEDSKLYLTETSLADKFSKTIEELTVTEDTESVGNTESADDTEQVQSVENTEE